MEILNIFGLLCCIAFASAIDPLSVRAVRYPGTKVHDNEFINVEWYSEHGMKSVKLLKTIDEDSAITVKYVYKTLSGEMKASSSDIQFCDYDMNHPDGHVVQLLRQALSIPDGCPIQPAEYESKTKEVRMDLGFGYDVNCENALVDIILSKDDGTPILEGTWGIQVLDEKCHGWF